MADVTTLSPELCRSVSALARTLVAAARIWVLYPADHPAVHGSLERLRLAVPDTADGQPFSFGVTPDTLLIEGLPVTGREAGPVAEVAAWLHQREILQLTFAGELTVPSLQRFLGLLSDDAQEVRARGGPARAWAEDGDGSIRIEQIDFSRLLENRDVVNPARRKDDVWRSIVRSVLDRHRPMDEAAQVRLLKISGDRVAIGELARDVMAPHQTAEGSPMLTSQAAAVIAAYRHLVGVVDVLAPERRTEVMQNLAAATVNLDPSVVMQMLHTTDEGGGTRAGFEVGIGGVVGGIIEAFDDSSVAQLLATTLAIDGRASQRLATVFNTIAPDDERKRRILSLTRTLLNATDFGRRDEFHTLWPSMEQMLLTCAERPFASAAYRTSLDQAGSRAAAMAAGELPDELIALIETLGQDNVRRLSVTLLIDLLRLERDAARAPELARDVAALAEDLLLAGDYESAETVVQALAEQAADPASVTAQGSRLALDGFVSTVAFREAADMFGDMAAGEAAHLTQVCRHIGPASTDALIDLLTVEEVTPGRGRATAVIREFGPRAVSRLAPLVDHPSWAARRNAADLLGEIGAPEGVPLLQPLLRTSDPRVTRAAVRALSSIRHPAAARSIHTVLRATTGEQRRAVVDALVAERDPRVVPVLVRILEESEPFGTDHSIVLDTLDALAKVGDDQAVPALATLMRKRRLLARRKVRAVREGSLTALRAIHTDAASSAIAAAAAKGDRLLRRLARAAAAQPHA